MILGFLAGNNLGTSSAIYRVGKAGEGAGVRRYVVMSYVLNILSLRGPLDMQVEILSGQLEMTV